MLLAIADTHAIIWYLFGDAKLSATAKTFLDTTVVNNHQIGLSSITLAEIVYLAEKKRINSDTFNRLEALLDTPNTSVVEIPFDRRIVNSMLMIDRLKVSDLPDRIIAATALHHNVPLVTRDNKIQASGVQTIW